MKITLFPYESAAKIGKEVFRSTTNPLYGLPEEIFDGTYEVSSTMVLDDKPRYSSIFIVGEICGWYIPGIFVSYISQ